MVQDLTTVDKPKIGRPPRKNQAELDEICNRIANGESLASICRDEGAPTYSSVMEWLAADPMFAERYTRARETQAERMAEEILEIADEGRNDTYLDEKGNKIVDYDHIQRSKLRVDARKWVAAKLLPKKYGERPNETHFTNVTNNNLIVVSEARRKELQERIARLENAKLSS